MCGNKKIHSAYGGSFPLEICTNPSVNLACLKGPIQLRHIIQEIFQLANHKPPLSSADMSSIWSG